MKKAYIFKTLLGCLILTLLVMGTVAAADEVPPLPAQYYGTVTIDGTPAPAGTNITALIENELVGTIETTETGAFGGPGIFGAKLLASPASDVTGKNVTFRIGTDIAKETVVYVPGDVQVLALTVVTSTPATVTTVTLAGMPENNTVDLNGVKTGTLTATVNDENGAVMSEEGVSWASTDTAVLDIDANGNYTALSVGSSVIIATSKTNASVTTNVTIAVIDTTPSPSDPVATTIVLGGLPTGSVDLYSGSVTGQLTAVVKDENGADMPGETVNWTTSNATVLTIDATGKYTALAVGTANITATAKNNSSANVSATITVIDTTPAPSDPVATTIVLGGIPTGGVDLYSGSVTGQLIAVVKDENGADMPGESVTWTSSNASVVTVDSNGNYTAHAVGTANITATAVSNSSATVSGVFTVIDTTPAPVDPKEVTLNLTTGIVDLYDVTVSMADVNATSIFIPGNTPFGALYSLYTTSNTVTDLHFWGGKYTDYTNWKYISLEDLNGLQHKATIDGVKYSWDGFVNGVKLDGVLNPAADSVTGYGTALKAGDLVTFAYIPAGGDLRTAKEIINITVGSVEVTPCKVLDDTTVTFVTTSKSVSFADILTAAGYTYVGVNGALVGSYSDREYLEQVTINNISYPARVNLIDEYEWKITDGFGTGAFLYKKGLNGYVEKSQSGSTFYLFFINTTAANGGGKMTDFQMEYSPYLVNLTVNIVDPVPTSITITAPVSGSIYNISDVFTAAATVYDQTGAEMPGASVVWTSSNDKAFTVNGAEFTAKAAGNVEIIATSGNATAKIPVVVLPKPVKPEVPPVVETGSDGQTVIDSSDNNVTVTDKKVEIKGSNVNLTVVYDNLTETAGKITGTIANVTATYPEMPIVSDTTELGGALTLDVKIDLGTNVETTLPTFNATINPATKQQIEKLKIDGKQYTVGLMLQSEAVAEGFNEKVGKVTLTFNGISNNWLAQFNGNLAIVHTADDGTVQVLTKFDITDNGDGTSKLTVESDLGFSAYALAGYTVTPDPGTSVSDNGGADDGAELLASVGAGAKPTVTAQPTTAPTTVAPTQATVKPTGSQQTVAPTTAATTAAATATPTQAPAPVFGLLLGLLGAAVLLRRT